MEYSLFSEIFIESILAHSVTLVLEVWHMTRNITPLLTYQSTLYLLTYLSLRFLWSMHLLCSYRLQHINFLSFLSVMMFLTHKQQN